MRFTETSQITVERFQKDQLSLSYVELLTYFRPLPVSSVDLACSRPQNQPPGPRESPRTAKFHNSSIHPDEPGKNTVVSCIFLATFGSFPATSGQPEVLDYAQCCN